MDCREQAKKIYELCVAKANANKDTLTYGEVLNTLGYKKGVSGQAIRYGLELVLIACADSGLPILTSIVVNQLTGSPSAGKYPESWENEAGKVFSYKEWPDVEPNSVIKIRIPSNRLFFNWLPANKYIKWSFSFQYLF